MTVVNRGTKRHCPACGTAYYDLGRTPIICPKCHVLHVETPRLPSRAPRARADVPAPIEPSEEGPIGFDEDEALGHDESDPDTLIEEDQEDEDSEERE